MTPQAEPPRSPTERALRWLSGADRREAEVQARAAALARAQADADRLAREAIERTAADRARAEADARAARVASVDAAATTAEPLVHVATPTGGSYHVRTADWLAARSSGARDVSLVDWQGDPVQAPPGERVRTTIRLSTIEASTLRPVRIVTAADLLPEQDQPSQEPNIGL